MSGRDTPSGETGIGCAETGLAAGAVGLVVFCAGLLMGSVGFVVNVACATLIALTVGIVAPITGGLPRRDTVTAIAIAFSSATLGIALISYLFYLGIMVDWLLLERD